MSTVTLSTSKTTWIVVADGMRARFLAWQPGARELEAAFAFDLFAPDVHGHARDLGGKKPGRGFSSGRDGRRHAYERRHDYHKLAKHAFATAVAEVLDAAIARRQFERLIVVAPRRSLGELRTMFSKRVRARIWRELAKDLTRETPTDLWARIQPMLGANPVRIRT